MPANPSDKFIRPEAMWRELGLRAGQTVVHLGCGAGFYLIPAARLIGDKGKAIGIDVRADMLAEVEGRARRDKLKNVFTFRADLENGPINQIKTNSVHWALIANAIYQSDPAKIIAEGKRMTVPEEGRIVLVEWDIVATPLGPPLEQRVSEQQIRDLLPALELEVVSTFDPSPYHYGLQLKTRS